MSYSFSLYPLALPYLFSSNALLTSSLHPFPSTLMACLIVLHRSSPPSHPAARGEAFDATVEHMATTEVSSSVYFIVGGSQPGQGAVITRDEQPVAKVTNITIIQRAICKQIWICNNRRMSG